MRDSLALLRELVDPEQFFILQKEDAAHRFDPLVQHPFSVISYVISSVRFSCILLPCPFSFGKMRPV